MRWALLFWFWFFFVVGVFIFFVFFQKYIEYRDMQVVHHLFIYTETLCHIHNTCIETLKHTRNSEYIDLIVWCIFTRYEGYFWDRIKILKRWNKMRRDEIRSSCKNAEKSIRFLKFLSTHRVWILDTGYWPLGHWAW